MLELQTQYPPVQPEPIFPELTPLEQDPPEDYDPETQDNTGHFPEQQASGVNRFFIMQNLFQMTTGEMLLKPKTQKLPAEEIREGDGEKPKREPNGDVSCNKGSQIGRAHV